MALLMLSRGTCGWLSMQGPETIESVDLDLRKEVGI